MTALELYKKHKVGEISKEKFLQEVRKDSQLPWISNLTSYDDAIKILKNKGIVTEDFQATITKSEMDQLSDWVDENYPEGITPTQFHAEYAGMHDVNMYTALVHLAKQGKLITKSGTKIGADKVEKIMDRSDTQVMSALSRPASANEGEELNEQKDLSLEIDRMNPKIVAKAIDFELEKLPVTQNTLETYFKIQKKVVNKLKKNPRAYDNLFVSNSTEVEKTDKKLEMQPVKKDNLVDKPNEMVKAKVMEAIQSIMKEGMEEFDYGLNKSVKLPEGGEGTIIGVKGGTLTVEMADGSMKDYQMNVIRHANNPEVLDSKEEPTVEEKKDDLMEKIKKFLKSLKMKNELKTFVPTNTNKTEINKAIDSDPSIPSPQKVSIKQDIKSGNKVTV